MTQEEIDQWKKCMCSTIHQGDSLAAWLGPNLNDIQDVSMQENILMLIDLKTSIVSIQLLLQDWKST
jgi:hypothetical protein